MKIYTNGEFFLEARVAESFLEKARGLMFEGVEEDGGLLMKFSCEGRREIWMPFVPQDLGLIFLNSGKMVIGKERAKKITLDPTTWKVYTSPENCKYVLECHPQKLNIVEKGDVIKW